MSVDLTLRVAIFWVAAVLCVVAEIFILRSMLRGSRSPVANSDSAPGAMVPRSPPAVELLWAIVPAVGLIIILVLTRETIR